MKKHDDIIQGTPNWHFLRKGKITGTTLKAIMGTPRARQEAVYEILAERLSVGDNNDEENPMDRGIRLEPEARAAFEFETGKKVEQTGFCESDESEFICNSPDGLVDDDTEGVEIKCFGGKNYVKFWLTNQIPDDYFWQVVQYFVVNKKLKKLWFVAYNPDIPSHPLHILEISREALADDIKQAEDAQVKFIKEVNETLKTLVKF